jgi:RNA polymerase sigma-70 factor (ECF subfamily)
LVPPKNNHFESLEETYPTSEQLHPESMTIAQMEQEKIRKALSFLTPDQRQVIVLRFIEDWEIEQVSIALHKPVGAIKALQHRALINLRKILT